MVSAEDASRLTRPARLDSDVLGYFRRALSEYYAADKMLGPCRLIGTVLAQIEVLDGLRRGARPPYADPLLQIIAQNGEMAGWLLQDAGDLDAAAGWSRRAAEWAHCAGDTQMAAYMLIRQANIATLTDDHAAIIHLAAAARRPPGPAVPKLTALALQHQARGHARLGVFRTCFTRPPKPSATTPPSATPPHRSTCTTTTPARWRNRPLSATAKRGTPTPP